jgi:hypothetical protein
MHRHHVGVAGPYQGSTRMPAAQPAPAGSRLDNALLCGKLRPPVGHGMANWAATGHAWHRHHWEALYLVQVPTYFGWGVGRVSLAWHGAVSILEALCSWFPPELACPELPGPEPDCPEMT